VIERDPLAPSRWSAEYRTGEFDEPFPWKPVLGVLGIVLVIVFAHLELQSKRIDELHTAINARLGGELEPLRGRFTARLSTLRAWLELREIDGPKMRAADLDFETIRSGGLLSVRRKRSAPGGGSSIELDSDEFGECLGVPSTSIARIQRRLAEFTPELRDEIDRTDHFLTLRGMQDQLDRRIDALLPELSLAIEARFLLLSEEDAEARELMLLLVDLESGQEKLRMRVPYEGRLLTARVMLDETTRAKSPGSIALPTELPKGASDCAAASTLREAIDGRHSIGEPMPEGGEHAAE